MWVCVWPTKVCALRICALPTKVCAYADEPIRVYKYIYMYTYIVREVGLGFRATTPHPLVPPMNKAIYG